MLQADDPQLQARALELMPLASMRADAQQTFNLNSEGTNLPGPLGLGVDDFLAKELLAWFKTSFFSWVDVAACQACGNTSTQSTGRALDELNYTPVNGKPIRIMWSHRDPSFRKSGLGNIFIKNLDKSIDNKALHDTFQAFGRILSCKVATDSNGQSRGYGFVHFETEEAAQLAITKVNGMMIEDRIVFVGIFQKRNERPTGRELFTNVYVKNLSLDVTDEELATLMAEFGETSSCVIMKDESGKSRGFGFVNFAEPEAAAKAVETLQGKEFKGKNLYAGRAQKKTERSAVLKAKFDAVRQQREAESANMNLYVRNLTDEVDDKRLRDEFSSCGTITSAKVMLDDKGMSKGFGFVCFSSAEEAARAVNEKSNHMVFGKPLYVTLAQRKDIRRAQLEREMAQRSGMARPLGPPGIPTMPPYAPMPMPYYGAPSTMARPYPGQQYHAPVPPAVDPTAPIDLAVLAAAEPEQQKQMLGERLYPLVEGQVKPELAGKITGMLLEMDNADLLILLDSQDSLVAKVKEAIDVLKAHNFIASDEAVEK
ncbi:polyadenylate-binding protein [Haematococcus lacustris]|uniref:Polyadenylate-binding protein n=1 Tax=Haematococcus lacustris TaxID=44745 RepID=A0A699YSB5_HAELA|nr:polyadenylate-binding protein [Haematococcus lacustris]